jgi:alpha-L-rhamnosidase
VSAHGLYQIHINGQRVSDHLFTPGWTSYNQRIQYQVYDVATLLQSGKNGIGVWLGDGWYRGVLKWEPVQVRNFYGKNLAAILQLEVTYSDGTKETILSDNSWKSTTGPILKSDFYDGETYDARLEKTGWPFPLGYYNSCQYFRNGIYTGLQ